MRNSIESKLGEDEPRHDIFEQKKKRNTSSIAVRGLRLEFDFDAGHAPWLRQN